MGGAKQQQIWDYERGVDSSNTGYNVCQNCFDNPGLRKFIAENAYVQDDPDNPFECDFCNSTVASDVVADMDAVCEHIVQCIRHRFRDPVHELPHDSREGGYQGKVIDTYEALVRHAELELPNDNERKLFDAINFAITENAWCQRNYFSLSPSAAMQFSWDEFQEVAKAGSVLEFIYGRIRGEVDTKTPVEFLDWLGDQSLEFGLIRTIRSGQKLYRVRWQDAGESWRSVKDVGPPPAEKAKANRLSPQGTVMTYVAESLETSLFETASGPGKFGVGEFSLLRDIRVLDLVNLPEPICFFDLSDADARDVLGFLRSFALDVSRPILPGGREHIEYVPTQIVTQHFRRRVQVGDEQVDGIRYRSSKHDKGVCIGLFADQLAVCDSNSARDRSRYYLDSAWLQMESSYEIQWEP